MVKQEEFRLEQFMDKYENDIDYNLGETCCYSMTLNEIESLSGNKFDFGKLAESRLAYSYIKGSPELRQLISGLYDRIIPDDVVITNGGIGGNFLTFYSLVEPGDHVIVLNPTYQQLSSVPSMFGAEVDILRLRYEDGFSPNLEELRSMVKKNTKMIVFNNPNNPTGTVISADVVSQIVDIAKENDSYILCDEVYRPLFHSLNDGEEPPKSIADIYEKGISTGSMSKTFSAAGTRLGWVASKDKEFIRACWVRRDYNMISVSMVDDMIAQYVLQNKDVVLERNYTLCRNNLKLLKEAVKESGGKLEFVSPKGATTAFVKVNIKDGTSTEQLADELAREYRTLVVPGETFGYPGFLRIGYVNREEDVRGGMKNLLDYVKNK
ncbi:DEKNAAC100664 [Brettanomyces naardenensis]|uniref:DEKNAAC100664 n=1 Tax=Brettanomyces naardenensis TaxID=13370 RepID=A0A448YFJ3_BRENA|nr:DEKNAAC100664 [Brettanomyces naardenensis]